MRQHRPRHQHLPPIRPDMRALDNGKCSLAFFTHTKWAKVVKALYGLPVPAARLFHKALPLNQILGCSSGSVCVCVCVCAVANHAVQEQVLRARQLSCHTHPNSHPGITFFYRFSLLKHGHKESARVRKVWQDADAVGQIPSVRLAAIAMCPWEHGSMQWTPWMLQVKRHLGPCREHVDLQR